MRGTLFGLMLALACAPGSGAPPAERATNATVAASGPVVSLQRTACFGTCPVYTISVSSAGLVTYEGVANVRRTGTASGRITPGQLEALLLELESAGFFTFPDGYTPSEPTCGRYSTDSPTVISSATFRGRTKRVEHYYGCRGVPGALTLLENRIDDVLGSRQWTGR